MITVQILINGQVIYARSAVNISNDSIQPQTYKLDTGRKIKHQQSSGAVKLAKKMLNSIKEVR